MRRYALAATGGTFDVLHAGHEALLSRSFEVADRVLIGLTGDALAARMGRAPSRRYPERLAALEARVASMSGPGRHRISMLDEPFGPAVLEAGVGALVVSEETMPRGAELNSMRAARGLPPVDVVVVPMVLAEDGGRISATRVREGAILPDGRPAS